MTTIATTLATGAPWPYQPVAPKARRTTHTRSAAKPKAKPWPWVAPQAKAEPAHTTPSKPGVRMRRTTPRNIVPPKGRNAAAATIVAAAAPADEFDPAKHPRKTYRIRAALARHGDMTASQIATRVPGVTAHDVAGLLHRDISNGVVLMHEGTYSYQGEAIAKLESSLQTAAALLRRHGYLVEAPQ